MITPEAFAKKMKATSVKRNQAILMYEVHCEVQDKEDKALLKAIFSNKKVRKRVADPISKVAEDLNAFIGLDRSVKQQKKQKDKTQEQKDHADIIKRINDSIKNTKSDVFTQYEDLAAKLSKSLTK